MWDRADRLERPSVSLRPAGGRSRRRETILLVMEQTSPAAVEARIGDRGAVAKRDQRCSSKRPQPSRQDRPRRARWFRSPRDSPQTRPADRLESAAGDDSSPRRHPRAIPPALLRNQRARGSRKHTPVSFQQASSSKKIESNCQARIITSKGRWERRTD